ncbi:PLP-dependent aminotransferase family protein [Brevibacterium spongiae]|uniref:PLP-dependent aminotransferase family protein n=1 Tax=Brevibacterium spongiae TaxID=2909672 RepID=A0ABY5SSN4_9MICO|nr:PLP-dependent aminotransferase family protein [Brevibacterium spongiae]UVI37562.1 PLP-dependent aminotransferase family protein [Brevibacterium spongiae]
MDTSARGGQTAAGAIATGQAPAGPAGSAATGQVPAGTAATGHASSAEGIALPLSVDKTRSTSLPDQLTQELRRLISEGALRPGDVVPSSRRLAKHLGISRGSVETAYAQLAVEGFLVTAERSTTRINPDLPTAPEAAHRRPRVPDSPRRRLRNYVDLRPGFGGDDPLREPAFRRAWRDSLDVDPGPVDPLGQPDARWAIADYLRLSRGMAVDPDEIILTSGSRDGLRLLLSLGIDGRIAVENPGFPGLRQAMTDQELVPLDITQGAPIPSHVSAAVVTPNHQFPHGTPMPVDQRVRLLSWASESGIILVEDDYDSEARFTRTVLPTLFDLASTTGGAAEVVHIGTFSTLLTSAVSTGYLIARGEIAGRLMALRTALGPAYSPILQMAIASYLGSGGLRRRISRGRRRLRAAEEVVADIGPIPGLVHDGRTLVIETTEADAQHLLRDLSDQGILVASLARGWTGGDEVRHGVVIAHSNVEASVLREALGTVQKLLSRMQS